MAERNAQVAQMSLIYRHARHVIVWLGPDSDDDCSAGIDTLQDIRSRLQVDWPSYRMALCPDSASKGWPRLLEEAELRNLQKLLEKPWFERLWVRQEIGLASVAEVVCGRRSMPWEAFRSSVLWLRLCQEQPKGITEAEFRRIETRLGLAHTVCDHKTYIIDTLRTELAGLKCFDDRDRLFALLSLLHPSHQELGISARYDLPTAGVYRDTTLSFISHFRSLAVLFQCELDPVRLVSLPSWVPDWSTEQTTFPLSGTPSNASAYIESVAEYRGHGVLRVAGTRVAAVAAVLPLPVDSLDFENLVSSIWSGLAATIQSRGVTETLDQLCHTLCCGLFRHTTIPARDDLPDWNFARTMFRRLLLRPARHMRQGLDPPDSDWVQYKAYASRFCRNRTLLVTENEDLALGPPFTRVQDILYVLLGCDSIMTLRPDSGATIGHCYYHIVGQSHMARANLGEVLVGKLPAHLMAVNYHDESSRAFHFAYFNKRTRKCQFSDPRLEGIIVSSARLSHY